MSSRDLLDRIKELKEPDPDIARVPPPELIAFTILWSRNLKSWKQSTLADFAGLSLSTIERAERGEAVSAEALDRIAEALGYDAGYFTAPRRPIGREKAAEKLVETYGELEPVKVAPLRTQAQVRALARCDAYLPHCIDLTEEYRPQVDALCEWIDFTAFELSDWTGLPNERRIQRRELYTKVLSYVRDLEKQGLNILAGVMEAPQERFPDWKVAVLFISLKKKDPGAAKRKFIFVDRRLVELRSEPTA